MLEFPRCWWHWGLMQYRYVDGIRLGIRLFLSSCFLSHDPGLLPARSLLRLAIVGRRQVKANALEVGQLVHVKLRRFVR
jgi:hypothetical protein